MPPSRVRIPPSPLHSTERCPSGLRSATGNRVRAERCVAGSNPALSAFISFEFHGRLDRGPAGVGRSFGLDVGGRPYGQRGTSDVAPPASSEPVSEPVGFGPAVVSVFVSRAIGGAIVSLFWSVFPLYG